MGEPSAGRVTATFGGNKTSTCESLSRFRCSEERQKSTSIFPRTTMTQMIYPYENGHPDVRTADDSLFSTVDPAPPVEIFALHKAYHDDNFSMKVDLTIGAYRGEDGRPWVLPVVRKVEEEITSGNNLSHEYLGQLGLEELSKAATKLLLGQDSPALKQNRAFGVQTVGGTGALRVGADFLVKCAKLKVFYMADPSWPSHHLVFPYAGFAVCRMYRYWHSLKKCLDIEGLIEDLRDAPQYSVVILHVCAHNPTGIDPSKEQWMRIADVMEERNLFPFFDCAYQGIASGDLEKDAWPVRYFVSRGFELVCAQSFSKNMGLYSERVGNLTLVFKDSNVIPNVRSHITMMIRGNYCNPPRHGAGIATRILNDNSLIEDWKNQLKTISIRIKRMRWALRTKLQELGAPGTWDHITRQIGMFCYSGLNEQQVKYLIQRYHIYLPTAGRINICGLNNSNVDYVARAINDAVLTYPSHDM